MTNNPSLEAEGEDERREEKVQEKIGKVRRKVGKVVAKARQSAGRQMIDRNYPTGLLKQGGREKACSITSPSSINSRFEIRGDEDE